MAARQTFLVSARLPSRTLQTRLGMLSRQLRDLSISIRVSSNISGSLVERRVSLEGSSKAVETAGKLLTVLVPDGDLIPIFEDVDSILTARALLLDHFLLTVQDTGNRRRLPRQRVEEVTGLRLEQHWLNDFTRIEGPNFVLRDFVEPMMRSQRQFQLQRIGVQ